MDHAASAEKIFTGGINLPEHGPISTCILKGSSQGAKHRIKRLLAAKSNAKTSRIINEAPIRFEKLKDGSESHWYYLTPLACAAQVGNPHLVRTLLLAGADPTLLCSEYPGIHCTAQQIAQVGEAELDHMITQVRNAEVDDIFDLAKFRREFSDMLLENKRHSHGIANSLLVRRDEYSACVNLLSEASDYWEPAAYRTTEYEENKRLRQKYSNAPKDKTALTKALNSVNIGKAKSTPRKKAFLKRLGWAVHWIRQQDLSRFGRTAKFEPDIEKCGQDPEYIKFVEVELTKPSCSNLDSVNTTEEIISFSNEESVDNDLDVAGLFLKENTSTFTLWDNEDVARLSLANTSISSEESHVAKLTLRQP